MANKAHTYAWAIRNRRGFVRSQTCDGVSHEPILKNTKREAEDLLRGMIQVSKSKLWTTEVVRVRIEEL